MAKPTTRYVCQACGASFPKWAGKCDACGEWNSLVEEAAPDAAPKGLGSARGRRIEFVGLHGSSEAPPRRMTGIAEFDRVCGGGLVPGSAILIGGDPGIGKSTLLLQAVARLAQDHRCAYVSGEEAVDQVRLRAQRLGCATAPVDLASATSVRDIVASLDDAKGPEIIVIDSIQTMYMDNLDSAPGTVAQVRASAQELIRIAKRRGVVLLLVGHVTKEGMIAGPRVLEHMVDTVLYFEGERGHQFRILRAVKNRFGPTDEIGVFEMGDAGLGEVANPSALFLAERRGDVSGAAVFAGMEGTRPVLVEVQALVAPSPLGTPRRAVVGWDTGRLAMVLAVLEARCGVQIGANDVYLNVAGGLRITEPAADLAVAAALVSSLTGEPVPADAVVFGEIGLSGEVRAVGQSDTRLKEAAKLGFSSAIFPAGRTGRKGGRGDAGLKTVELQQLAELMPLFQGASGGGRPPTGRRSQDDADPRRRRDEDSRRWRDDEYI
ncbi:DNA repair protein RadA [Azospirillum thiophilum]|uniref:DNA repair protein RadA n=1 Tax=Azospirillum thiophilum TaxID=528244 RepID=A0AAC8VXP5_9PROT|nr:DNA repair protein RadA [Azospirillum thiophilum]ALG71385.1 DNA repair protein RadA [Azospirillum thiophilum]KJR64963.1 DNA repair protein RadA [Azospirillum thiophilum]